MLVEGVADIIKLIKEVLYFMKFCFRDMIAFRVKLLNLCFSVASSSLSCEMKQVFETSPCIKVVDIRLRFKNVSQQIIRYGTIHPWKDMSVNFFHFFKVMVFFIKGVSVSERISLVHNKIFYLGE